MRNRFSNEIIPISKRYEDGSDLSYFDGLSDTILSVALLRPKKDIFQAHIKYLLCLTTAVEIILLGVGFGGGEEGESRFHQFH